MLILPRFALDSHQIRTGFGQDSHTIRTRFGDKIRARFVRDSCKIRADSIRFLCTNYHSKQAAGVVSHAASGCTHLSYRWGQWARAAQSGAQRPTRSGIPPPPYGSQRRFKRPAVGAVARPARARAGLLLAWDLKYRSRPHHNRRGAAPGGHPGGWGSLRALSPSFLYVR